MLGDARTQSRVAFGFGIAEMGAVERRMGGFDDLGRSATDRLAGFHMHDVGAAIRHFVGDFENFHGVKRRDVGALGDFHSPGPVTTSRRWRGRSHAGRKRTRRSPGCAAHLPGNERHSPGQFPESPQAGGRADQDSRAPPFQDRAR